ncbi:hypothetical protein HYU18_04950 [Candidatus Woesearchaeota archaeon]|nr:hypothetical protein [Candidatus Woesearchaeota archaeon]
MKAEYIFFTIGLIFLFSTIAYFSYNYLFSMANSAKTGSLLLLTVAFFFLGNVLKQRDV